MAINFNGVRIRPAAGGGGGGVSWPGDGTKLLAGDGSQVIVGDGLDLSTGTLSSRIATAQLNAESNTKFLMHFEGDFIDVSANPLTLVVNNSVTITSAQSKFGGTSGYFNGNASNILRATSATNKISFGTNSFTLEGWFYFNSINAGYQPILSFANNSDQQGPLIYVETNNTLGFFASSNGSSWAYSMFSSVALTAGTWHHIALVGTSGQHMKIYLNGTNVATVNGAYDVFTSNNFYFGHYPYFPGGAITLNGYIDEVRFSNTARYSGNFIPSTIPFSASTVSYPQPETGIIATDQDNNNLLLCIDGNNNIWKKIALSHL